MGTAVPPIETADHADALRVGGPDRKMHTRHHADRHAVRAESLPGAVVRPLGKQMQVDVAQDLAKLVGIDDIARESAFAHAEPVGEFLWGKSLSRDNRLEQAFGTFPLHSEDTVGRDELHVGRGRLQRTNDQGGTPVHHNLMAAEHGAGVVARARRDRVKRRVVRHAIARRHALMISSSTHTIFCRNDKNRSQRCPKCSRSSPPVKDPSRCVSLIRKCRRRLRTLSG